MKAMGLLSILKNIAGTADRNTVVTFAGLVRSLVKLVRPRHPLVGLLGTVATVATAVDDSAVDGVLVAKLRTLKIQLDEAENDIEKQRIQARITAIQAVLA